MMVEELEIMPADQAVVPWKSAIVTFLAFLVLGGLPMLPYLFSWKHYNTEPPSFITGTDSPAALPDQMRRSHFLDLGLHLRRESVPPRRVQVLSHWKTVVAGRLSHDTDRHHHHWLCGVGGSVSHRTVQEAPQLTV